MKIPGLIHPTGELCMAVHLIGYGSVPILCSVLYLSVNPWEAPGCQVIAVNADVKQVITSWLQTLNKCLYHCVANAKMVLVTMLRSDVYHLPHMCHVLIKVTITFWRECVCYLIILKFFFLYTLQCEQVNSVFWMVEFLCHLLIIFTMNYLL
jgi:hypothetical protein